MPISLQILMCVAHRSSPDVRIIPRSNARSNARIVLSSKIVLPSSNVEEYSGIILRGTISRIVNPEGSCV